MAEKEIRFNGWIDNPDWVKPGEPVNAEVVNRPVKQVFQDVEITAIALQNHLEDYDNPHRVSLEQLGFDTEGVGSLKELVQRIIYDIAGSFVAEGMDVSVHEFDDPNSKVILTVSAGRAYREGETIIFDQDQYVEIPTDKYYFPIIGELQQYTPGVQVYKLQEGPLRRTTQVLLDVVRVEQVTRGSTPGGQDELQMRPVRRVLKVYQGDTVYKEGTDYRVTSNGIDWSLGGAEPNPGSTYYVVYVYGRQLTKGTEYVDGSLLKKDDKVDFFIASVDSDGKESSLDTDAVKSFTIGKTGKYLKVYWNSVPGATAYRVYASVNGGTFKLVGQTTSTSMEFWGVTQDITPAGGGSVGPAEIHSIEDYHPNGITLTGHLDDSEARYIREDDNYPGLLIVSYEYHVPIYAILEITKNGLTVKWGEPDDAGNPKPPTVDADAVALAKLWVPALDVSKFFMWDIKARPPKAKLLQSIQNRLDSVEDDIMRMKLALGLANKYTGTKSGSFVDDFSKPDHIDWGRDDLKVDFTGSEITSPRINTGTIKPNVSEDAVKALITGKKVHWETSTNSLLLSYTHQEVYKQNVYTRTVDLAGATFDVSLKPGVYTYPRQVHQGGWIYVYIWGFAPNADVTITINGVQLGTIQTNVFGYGWKWFKIPNDLIDQSAAVKVAKAANAQVQKLAQSVYSILKSAERSLWPIRRTYKDEVVARWWRSWSWTSSWTNCMWWWCRRITTVHTTVERTDLHKVTATTYIDKLGLKEEPMGTLNLMSTIRSSVEARDQEGHYAIRNVILTSGPVTVPMKAPVLTKQTDVHTTSWYYTRTTRWFYNRSIVTGWWRDPIAESFTMPNDGFISRVGIRLATVPDEDIPVIVRIGRLENGLPSKEDLKLTIPRSEIVAKRSADGWVYIDLPEPVYYKKGTKLYVSFGAPKPGYRAYVAKVGDNLPDGTKLTKKVNPAQVFFTSSNAETWTPDQSTNMCFSVSLASFENNPNISTQLRAGYECVELIEFPEMDVPAGATLVAVHSDTELKPTGTEIGWYVGIPTPQGDWKWIPVEEDRETPLGANVNKMKLRMVLRGSKNVSPVIDLDGIHISHLAYGNTGTYISTMFQLTNSSASNADIYIYADIPEGQDMTVWFSANDGQDWIQIGDPPEVTDYDLNRNIREYKYSVELPSPDSGQNEGKFRLKIEFTSDGIEPTVIDQVGVILR